METLIEYFPSSYGVHLAIAMLVTGAVIALLPQMQRAESRGDMKKRLRVEKPAAAVEERPSAEPAAQENALREQFVKRAKEFYLKADPDNVARIRGRLVQGGYFDPGAVGIFFALRFVTMGVAFVGALLAGSLGSGLGSVNTWVMSIIVGGLGYFLPGLVLAQQIKAKMTEYRNGFPDFMDLMVVCSDAGISMEAGIERVSRELLATHPSLAQNLQLVTIELRAGRSLDETLKALGDRLGLEEVRAFATLLQQSRELGTSLSGALRVFSDEMRHKRMSRAEEKAHALPAKLSVPVTVCILPVVLLVAIIPVIVRLSTGGFE